MSGNRTTQADGSPKEPGYKIHLYQLPSRVEMVEMLKDVAAKLQEHESRLGQMEAE